MNAVALVDMLPTFDPTWAPAVQQQWLKAFAHCFDAVNAVVYPLPFSAELMDRLTALAARDNLPVDGELRFLILSEEDRQKNRGRQGGLAMSKTIVVSDETYKLLRRVAETQPPDSTDDDILAGVLMVWLARHEVAQTTYTIKEAKE